MALWAVAFLGSTPVGGPLIGWIVAVASARVGLAVGGVSCFVAAGLGLVAMSKLGMLGAKGHDGRVTAGSQPSVIALDLAAEGD